MLNDVQKNFRKQMKNCAYKMANKKHNEVFSYIEDKHIKNYYTDGINITNGRKLIITILFIINVLIWSNVIKMLL